MPFGLTNTPATIQRTIDIILVRIMWMSCLVFVEDIIMFASTFELTLRHVAEILRALHAAGLSLKLKKFAFFDSSANYLGHTIPPRRLEVANRNTGAIQGFIAPTSQTGLRSFIGLCNVHRRFVPNFARVSAPFMELLTKEFGPKLPQFDERRVGAFNLFKNALVSPPVLRLRRQNLRFSVELDARDHQLRCALFQTHEDGKRYPLGFWSRQLRPAEKNYSAGEMECLAMI